MPEHTAKVTMGENGRLVLPALFRKALGLTGAGQVVLTLEDDAVRVTSVRRRLLDARARFRRFVPAGQGLVDALLDERRAEQAQEDAAIEAAADAASEASGGEQSAASAAGSDPDDLR